MRKRLGKFILLTTWCFILVELGIYLFVTIYSLWVAALYRGLSNKDIPRIKILAVGESTTFGLWVEDNSYPLQLRSMLNGRLNCSCAAVDILSSPGGNTSGLVSALLPKIQKFRPDVILMMVGNNDYHYYTYNIDALLYEKSSRLWFLPPDIYRQMLKFLNKFRTFRIVKYLYVNYFADKELVYDLNERFVSPAAGSPSRLKFYQNNAKLITENTKNNISKLIDIIKLNRIVPVILTYHGSNINPTLRQIAVEKNVFMVDNEPLFPQSKLASLILPKDNWHPNASGYKLIAENVMNKLFEYELIQDKFIR